MDVAFSYSDYTTHIKGITDFEQSSSNEQPEAVFSLEGNRLSRLHKGLNIMRLKNGKVVKVMKGLQTFEN